MSAELYVGEAAITQRRLHLPAEGRPEMAQVIPLRTAGTDFDDESLAMMREILSDPGALAEIAAARDEIARGDVVRGVEAVRALRPHR
jgi:hypothetical protein